MIKRDYWGVIAPVLAAGFYSAVGVSFLVVHGGTTDPRFHNVWAGFFFAAALASVVTVVVPTRWSRALAVALTSAAAVGRGIDVLTYWAWGHCADCGEVSPLRVGLQWLWIGFIQLWVGVHLLPRIVHGDALHEHERDLSG